MNVDSLKSELQQVLENDVALRKEFNELKRSLSDYRNQLIMRDEDCKRLQVTIDVLNTKLLVMERDNTSYKAELTSFKDLRDSINEQLQEKQGEIDARLLEIQGLRDELTSISSEYESRLENINVLAYNDLEALKAAHAEQLQELRSNIYYKESGLKEEYENRIAELTHIWADKEQSLILNHEEQVIVLLEQNKTEIEQLKQEYASQLAQLSSTSTQEIEALQLEHTSGMSALEQNWTNKLHALETSYSNEIESLKSEQSSLLTQSHLDHEQKIAAVIQEYEEKLSNILIHSNSQNSKLNEELNRSQSDAGEVREQLILLQGSHELKDVQLATLNQQLTELKNELVNEAERYATLNSDFEIYKQNASLSDDDKISDLNAQIAHLNNEINNMSLVFETSTNQLAETEKQLELKTKEIEELTFSLNQLNVASSTKEEELEVFKAEFQLTIQDEIHQREVEFQKLLAENTNLISEIDQSQDRVEALEAELQLLQSELEQMRLQTMAKSEDFKETLSAKQSEIEALLSQITALEENNQHLNEDNKQLKEELELTSQGNEQLALLLENNAALLHEQAALQTKIADLSALVGELQENLLSINAKSSAYELEIAELKSSGKVEEQEAFIDRLFKQIDHLNDQRMALLDEKEQMANQLLKMNDAIGSISQQVDNERIDVTGLNNHRKSVILANNSNERSESSQMKEQINNLVREIDKCIALLSA